MTTDTKPYHLYRVLGVAKESTTEEITRAYRRLALQYHPDRNPDGTERFKALSNAYALLSDADRRAAYDLNGFLFEGASSGDAAENMSDAAARQQRSADLADQVRDFFAAYAGSAEETADMVKGYVKCAGNFKKMVREYLLFDNGVVGEVQRLHRLAQRLITAGTLTATPAWTESTTTRSILKLEKSMRREREEAEEALKELASAGDGEDGGLGALQLAMQQRQAASYRSMLDNLEAKYVAKKPKGNAWKRSSRTRGEEGEVGGGKKRRKEEKPHDRGGAQGKAKRADF